MPRPSPRPGELERVRAEQMACAQYILSGGPDQRGAWDGLRDWYAEEILILELTDSQPEPSE